MMERFYLLNIDNFGPVWLIGLLSLATIWSQASTRLCLASPSLSNSMQLAGFGCLVSSSLASTRLCLVACTSDRVTFALVTGKVTSDIPLLLACHTRTCAHASPAPAAPHRCRMSSSPHDQPIQPPMPDCHHIDGDPTGPLPPILSLQFSDVRFSAWVPKAIRSELQCNQNEFLKVAYLLIRRFSDI